VVCAGADKPLAALALLQALGAERAIVFTGSVQSTQRCRPAARARGVHAKRGRVSPVPGGCRRAAPGRHPHAAPHEVAPAQQHSASQPWGELEGCRQSSSMYLQLL